MLVKIKQHSHVVKMAMVHLNQQNKENNQESVSAVHTVDEQYKSWRGRQKYMLCTAWARSYFIFLQYTPPRPIEIQASR